MQVILTYHPEIPIVDGDGRRFVIVGSVPEFDSDINILKNLGKSLKVRTVGEVASKIKAGLAAGLNLVMDAPRKCTCRGPVKKCGACQGRVECMNAAFRSKSAIQCDVACESL